MSEETCQCGHEKRLHMGSNSMYEEECSACFHDPRKFCHKFVKSSKRAGLNTDKDLKEFREDKDYDKKMGEADKYMNCLKSSKKIGEQNDKKK